MAAFLSAHGELASVLDPSDPGVRSATYRYSVGYSGQGSKVDMTISLTGGGEEGILWSRSWRADDPAAVDLKKQMSFGAARALLCALEASRDPTPLGSSLLRLYIVACSGLYGDEAPATQLASEFAQIAALRPRFAPAWQNLAIARSIIFVEDAQNNGVQSAALRDATLAAIGGARKLTPNSGRLLLAQANLANLDWRRELPLLDRAIALEPNEAIFYTIRSTALQEVGRMEDAVADAEKGVELDPLSPIAAASRINALMYAGQLTNAKDEIASAYKIWPNDPDLKAADFGFSMRYGDPRHGEQLVTKVLTNQRDQDMLPVRKVLIARENPTQANVEEALSAWRAAMESFPPAANHYLLALGTFGRMEEALRLAANSKLRPFLETQIFFRPEFEKMRHDPRFMAVAAQYGLVRYWKSSGNWPDFCSDVGLRYQCKTEAAKYS
jgi:tetratricopeptide (TPR) repeat protein